MYIKLALRNVKRQMGKYLIYFMTVALTVALMFAVDNIIFNQQLTDYAINSSDLKDGLTGITVFISLIVAFVLSYATSFMMKLRKREFGTYLTLGMTRKNILMIFLAETLLMCCAALFVGIGLGLVIYQCLMMLVMKLMDMEFAFGAYSVKGLLFTVALAGILFAVSSLASALYLKRVSIQSLLRGERVNGRRVRYPLLWCLLAVFSLMILVMSCIQFREAVRETIVGESAGEMMLKSLLVFAVSMILFHISLARGAVGLLLKSRRLCSQGTNTFLFRQLSSSLGINSVMLGLLSFLLAFAVIGANASFVQKMAEDELLNRDYPYDIMYSRDLYGDDFERGGQEILPAQAEPIIEKYAEILEKHEYKLYTDHRNYLGSFTKWSGEGYEGLTDSYMTESDFNEICVPLGYDPVELEDEFLMVINTAEMMPEAWKEAEPVLNGKTYHYRDGGEKYPIFQYIYFFAVVPDEAVEGMQAEAEFAAYRLAGSSYDVYSLKRELTYLADETYRGETFSYERCDYSMKEYGRRIRNENLAVFVVGALYAAAVFLFMALAILALKTLSNLSEDQKKYRVLFQLGTGEREQSRTLFWQTFCFFFLPYGIPALMSIPVAMICGMIMKMNGLTNQVREVYLTAGVILLVMTLIYALYYAAAYLIAKRSVVCREKE